MKALFGWLQLVLPQGKMGRFLVGNFVVLGTFYAVRGRFFISFEMTSVGAIGRFFASLEMTGGVMINHI